MGFIEKLSGSSLLLSLLTGLGIAVCVIAIISVSYTHLTLPTKA